MITLFLYHVDLTDGGEGWSKGFTLAFHAGSDTHIFKTKSFSQNTVFKSIELFDRLEREKILTDSCELRRIPVMTVSFCIWKW